MKNDEITPERLKRLAERLDLHCVIISNGFVHFEDNYYKNIHFNHG